MYGHFISFFFIYSLVLPLVRLRLGKVRLFSLFVSTFFVRVEGRANITAAAVGRRMVSIFLA